MSQVGKTRIEYLAVVKAALGTVTRAVEVGVLRGRYSAKILAGLDPHELVLVDPWVSQDGSLYPNFKDNPQAAWDARYAFTVKKFQGDPRVRILRQFSVPAAAQFPDHAFDFVYIDANHTYAAVASDLAAWKPKVRPGGVLAGHDWVPDWADCGVPQAVLEHFPESAITLTTETRTPRSWFVRM